MTKHLNLSTIVDKNKIASENSFVVLLAVAVQDSAGVVIETIRFCKNSENVTYQGNVYQAANFALSIEVEANKEPSISLAAQDQTRTLAQYIDLYDGLINNEVTMTIVNSASLDAPPEMEETFLITHASVSNYVVSFELGVDNATAKRFPNYRQFKDRCVWKYKGARCKYTGNLPTCDYSRTGPNGCAAHGNEINFGGFPGINER